MVETIMYKIITNEMETFWGYKVKVVHRLETNDWLTAMSILQYDEYKAKDISYNEGDVFVDIGSHIGIWGLLMATKNPSYRVFCFEPIPENYEIIKQVIEENNLKNMFVYNLAVSDKSHETEKIYYTKDDTNFGKEHHFVGSMQGGSSQYIEVPTIALNDILDYIEAKQCRVLKIDCEGCEIKGFGNITSENLDRIDYIVGEFHPWSTSSQAFFEMFKGKFDNMNFFNVGSEIFTLQEFIFKRIGVNK